MRVYLWIVSIGVAAWGHSFAHGMHDSTKITIIAFGDVNLGRKVGQSILSGDTTYPLRLLADTLRSADVAIVNLEGPLSDQGGETQNPRNNLIFCGPPAGARSLAWAGIDAVSTANNHAFDYGAKGMAENLKFLAEAGVLAVGSTAGSGSPFDPVILVAKGIRIGFVAFTEFMNFPAGWQGSVALFDTSVAGPVLRELRGTTDVVVASYHGGIEYADRPPKKTTNNIRWIAEQGADVILGHHPHVPQGYERHGSGLIFWSLGNCVFYQPQKYWTQIGFGVRWSILKAGDSISVSGVELLPVRAGLQPGWDLSQADKDSILVRLKYLTPNIHHFNGSAIPIEVH